MWYLFAIRFDHFLIVLAEVSDCIFPDNQDEFNILRAAASNSLEYWNNTI